jgi:hypothetical protein
MRKCRLFQMLNSRLTIEQCLDCLPSPNQTHRRSVEDDFRGVAND